MALTTVKSDQIQTSVALAGSPTTTTQSASDNSTKVATTAYVETAVANLVASAPAALNTLDELAAALNDDASFSTTVTNSIATKLPLTGGTLTGDLDIKGGATPLGVYRTLAIAADTQSEIVLGSQDLSNNYVDAVKIRGLLKANKTDGELVFYTRNSGTLTTALTINSSQNATFAGTIAGGAVTTTSNLSVGTTNTSQFVTILKNHTGYTDIGVLNNTSISDLYLGVGGSGAGNTDLRNAAYVLAGGANSVLILGTNTDEKMRIDGSGNVGIGATPHSWGTFQSVAQIGRTGAIANYDGSNSNQQTIVASNTYYGASGYTAIEGAAKAVFMNLQSGDINFLTAPITSAGSAQTFTNVLNITNAGAATFSGSVTSAGLTSSGPINLTAGALAAAGNAGLSHRSSDNKVYLQAGTGGFNILDDQQNTHFYLDSAGAATFSSTISSGAITSTGAITGDSFINTAVRYIANQIQSGYSDNSDNSDIWINYRGYQGGTTYFRDFRVGDGKQAQLFFVDGSAGNVSVTNALTVGSTISSGAITSSGIVTASRFINGSNSSDPWLKGINSSGTETSFIKKDGSAFFSSSVGIGTVPATKFDVMAAGVNQWYIRNSDSSAQNNAIVSLRTGGYSNIALDGATVDLKIAGSSKVHVDSSGDVTMSNQPYAHGVIAGNIIGPSADYGIALTTHASRNITAQTNSTHGPGITITRAGFYIMSMSFLQDPVSTYIYAGWCVNGSMVHHWHSNHTVSNHDAHSSIGKYLNVGDHVTIERTTANGITTIYGNTHSYWWICKIS